MHDMKANITRETERRDTKGEVVEMSGRTTNMRRHGDLGENILGNEVTILREKKQGKGREKAEALLTCGRIHLKNLTR